MLSTMDVEDCIAAEELQEKEVYERITPDRYVDNIRKKVDEIKRKKVCCASNCFTRMTEDELDDILLDVHFARSGGYQRWWMWIRTIIICSRHFVAPRVKGGILRRAKHLKHYNLPSLDRPLCVFAFSALLGISQHTLSMQTRSPPNTSAPFPHKNTGSVPAHALTPSQTSTVVEFVLAVAEDEAVPNPRFCFENEDDPQPVKVILQLPPSVSYNALYRRYAEWVLRYDPASKVCFQSFLNIMQNDKELSHVKLSKRITGMCEYCKGLRLRLQRATDATATERMNDLYVHLRDAFRLMEKYKERISQAKMEWVLRKTDNSRMQLAVISFDFATQIKLPVSAMETQGDWMKNTFGLSINVFGITHEGEGRHHHFIYPEGFSHGSANVVSMVDLFLRDNVRIGNAKKLVVYTDSCGGQNRNNFVMAYFITRVCAGLHEEISWNFMIV